MPEEHELDENILSEANQQSTDTDAPIVTDEDAQENLYDESGSSIYPYGYLFDKETIDIREDKISSLEIIRKLEKGNLFLDPAYQRAFVWPIEKQSRFIESMILGIPLPPIYLNQDKKGNYIVVDGKQRITTISDFMSKGEHKFKLQGLEALLDLNGKSFDDLKELDKRNGTDLHVRIEDKNHMLYVIKPTVPIEIVYDIFNRINTGGTILTRQEVRNCIYQGRATEFLNELAELDIFKKAIDYGISPDRMKDREVVLRYLAFKIFDYKIDYKDSIDYFLGKTMKHLNMMEDKEEEKIKADFLRVMEKTYDFFGKNNFRFPTRTTRGRINISMLESIGHFFSNKSNEFLNNNKDKIIENFNTLLSDPNYNDAVRLATADRNRVIRRFKRAEEILGSGINETN
ncbi:MAG: DUF262 domain-containing protein [Nitrospirae bacterium]|nr:DUF262 domain-containing protein [Nitrospirota bacterium]